MHLGPVAVVGAFAVEALPLPLPVAVAPERVDFGGLLRVDVGNGIRPVRPEQQVLRTSVAPVEGRLLHRIVLVDDVEQPVAVRVRNFIPRLAGRSQIEVRRAGPVGRRAQPILTEEVEESTVVAQLHAEGRTDAVGGAVIGVGLRGVPPDAGLDRRIEGLIFEAQIRHARDGVGSVLRGRPVPEHLNSLDGVGRDRVQVNRTRPARHPGPEPVDEGRLVSALAVYEHQRLVRTQATERERTEGVHPVGERVLWKVDRRRTLLKNPPGLEGPRRLDLFRPVHIHGHRHVLGGHVAGPGPDGDRYALSLQGGALKGKGSRGLFAGLEANFPFDCLVPDKRHTEGVRPRIDACDAVGPVSARRRAVVGVQEDDVGPWQGCPVRVLNGSGKRSGLLGRRRPHRGEPPCEASKQKGRSVA